ncbi:MAG TPA: hypothetical protein VMI06_16340 [Terriglobia bacterium]|nr:hypothetical protein [Terriglobia bacterium]
MATAKEATPARVKRKGAKSGMATEYTGFFKIKPGHANQLVKEILASLTRRGDVRESYARIGVYDASYTLFDNDTRLLLKISFDTDFDTYFDDALAILAGGDKGQTGGSWFNNLEGLPGSFDSLTWEEFKNWLVAQQTEAAIFANTSDGSVKGIQKALHVQKAFQQVLDDPEAAQALKHPALKPLLDEAAV